MDKKVSSQLRAQAIHQLLKSEGWRYLDTALKETRQQLLEDLVQHPDGDARSHVQGIDRLYELITTLQNDAALERSK